MRSLAALAGALGVIASASCTNIPGVSTAWVVQSVVPRGPYLDATLTRGGDTQRYFTLASPECRSLLRIESAVEVVSLGPLGQFKSGDTRCEPVGIASLKEWRDSRPRPEVGPLPSRRADYRLEYQDQEVAMLRGRFPLTGLIGFPSIGDVVVVLPQNPTCIPLLTRTVATIEYRVAGPDPFVLLSERERCAVLGLIQPPGGQSQP